MLTRQRELEANSGFPVELFVNYPKDREICPVCMNVVNDPRHCSNGHMSCLACFTKLFMDSQRCAKCRVQIYKKDVDNKNGALFAKQVIDELQAHCECFLESPENGCGWVGEFQYHASRKCQFVREKCQNNGCQVMVEKYNQSQRENHARECLKRLVGCLHCNKHILAEKLDDHVEICVERLCTCECDEVVRFSELSDHRKHFCSLTNVNCPLFLDDCCGDSCTGYIPRGRFEDHMSKEGFLAYQRLKEKTTTTKAGEKRKHTVLQSHPPSPEVSRNEEVCPFKAAVENPSLECVSRVVERAILLCNLDLSTKMFVKRNESNETKNTSSDEVKPQKRQHSEGFTSSSSLSSEAKATESVPMVGENTNYVCKLDADLQGCTITSSLFDYVGRIGFNDKMYFHGRGKLSIHAGLDAGDIYDGLFINGKCHGFSVLRRGNGDTYVGDFCNHVCHGYGELRTKNEKIISIGRFDRGVFVKGSVIDTVDGTSYFGSFSFNSQQKHGKGKYFYANGDVFSGMWVHGVKNGHGDLYVAEDKQTFEGEWVDGELHGKCVLTFANEEKYNVVFNRGKPTQNC